MTPVIILGGILGGVFTPTEASAVAAAYALFIGLFVMKSLECCIQRSFGFFRMAVSGRDGPLARINGA